MSRLSGFLTGKQVAFVCRWLLAIVFIHAALGKITNTATFADDIANYRILPLYAVNVFAMVLPWVELLSGLCLINGVKAKSGALLIGFMNVVFIAAAVSALARGLNIECGCKTLAETSTKVGLELIVRDFVLILLCVPVIFQRECRTEDTSSAE